MNYLADHHIIEDWRPPTHCAIRGRITSSLRSIGRNVERLRITANTAYIQETDVDLKEINTRWGDILFDSAGSGVIDELLR